MNVMIELIPAILAKTEEEFRDKIEKIRPLATTVHIDVMDGRFVDTVTWAPPEKMKSLLGALTFEAHLMVADPEHAAMVWLAAGASRVYFHAETTARDELMFKSALDKADKLGVAINPDTPLSRLTPVLDRLRWVLVMGVTPGQSGQTFQAIATDKIMAIKNLRPSINVAVDGGVKPENAAELVKAGAEALVSASAFTDDPSPMLALARFKEVLNLE